METIKRNVNEDLFQFLKDELRIFEETCEEFNENKLQNKIKITDRKMPLVQKPKLLPKPKLFPKPNLVFK